MKLLPTIVIALATTTAGCLMSSTVLSGAQHLDDTNAKEASRLSTKSLRTSVQLGGCQIEAKRARYWRDETPFVTNAGPGRGSPLYTSILMRFHNVTNRPRRLTFTAEIHDSHGGIHSVPFHTVRSNGRPWFGDLAAGEQREVEFLSHHGPYLFVGTMAFAVFTWRDVEGGEVRLRAPSGQVGRATGSAR